jgi:hypothetical protein
MSIDPVLLHVIIALIVVGVFLGLVNRYIPMAGSIKSLLNGVVLIVMLIYVLQMFHIIGAIGGFHF